MEWERFKPFASHLNAAIEALPRVSTALYRGGTHEIQATTYPLGALGSWGGCVSASSDRRQALSFVDAAGALQARQGCYFLIISDEARPMYHLSAFPEEMEHLHPLGMQLEVCNVLPASILQMLALNINIVTLKIAGRSVPLELHLDALDGLAFIYDPFLAAYVSPEVKVRAPPPRVCAAAPGPARSRGFGVAGLRARARDRRAAALSRATRLPVALGRTGRPVPCVARSSSPIPPHNSCCTASSLRSIDIILEFAEAHTGGAGFGRGNFRLVRLVQQFSPNQARA